MSFRFGEVCYKVSLGDQLIAAAFDFGMVAVRIWSERRSLQFCQNGWIDPCACCFCLLIIFPILAIQLVANAAQVLAICDVSAMLLHMADQPLRRRERGLATAALHARQEGRTSQ